MTDLPPSELPDLERRYEELVRRSGQRDPEFERLLADAKEKRAVADAWAAYVRAQQPRARMH